MRKLLCRDATDTTDASDTLASVAESLVPRLTGWTTLTFGSQSRWKAQESNETVKKAVPWAFFVLKICLTLPKNWKNACGKHARKHACVNSLQAVVIQRFDLPQVFGQQHDSNYFYFLLYDYVYFTWFSRRFFLRGAPRCLVEGVFWGGADGEYRRLAAHMAGNPRWCTQAILASRVWLGVAWVVE